MRLRPAASLGLIGGFTEAVLRRDELAAVDLAPSCAIIAENEVTYLALPVPTDGVVLWGRGFDVARPGSLPWLGDVPVWYWGNLDTHGFAILDRLRAWLPRAAWFGMDRDTLLAHRERWVREPGPTHARLDRLTADEAALYDDLVRDRYADRVRLEQERGPDRELHPRAVGGYADRVRLEQERVDRAWVEARLPYR